MGPSPGRIMAILFFTVLCAITVTMGAFGGPPDRVLLSDVNVLTLHSNRMTSGRRSSPVPQLKCVGGNAKEYFKPDIVQCYNRGWDGSDFQWECKTDMDNAYRFGAVEVVCEGYDYPDDPYILKGSCGLEYTVELTEEGHQRHKQHKSHSYGGSYSSHYDHGYGSIGKKSNSVVGDLLFLGGIAVVIYVIYKSCIAPGAASDGTSGNRAQADRGDSPPPYSPPPYGFRQEYMPGSDNCYGSSTSSGGCQGSGAYTGTGSHSTHNQGGGFWTGAATGGLLGYLFGRNNSNGGYTHYQQPHYGRNRGWGSGWGTGWGSGWGSGSSSSRSNNGGSSFFSGGGGSGSASASSGTRTASGFGGTRRR